MSFYAKLAGAWESSGSMLCVGLDPDSSRMPAPLDGAPDAIERFCFAIVDVVPPTFDVQARIYDLATGQVRALR